MSSRISIQSSEHQDLFVLSNGTEKQATISFNPATHTARVDCYGSKRMFIIEEEEGILQTRTILKNEYGVKIGQLNFDKWHTDKGFIEIEDEHYHYNWKNNSDTEVSIFKKKRREPLLSFTIDSKADTTYTSSDKKKKSHQDKFQCLLMSLCWYLFVPAHQTAMSHAV